MVLTFILNVALNGCTKPPDGTTSPPTSTIISVYIPFNLEKPKSNQPPFYVNKQIDYKAKLFVKTTDQSGVNAQNYSGSPYIEYVINLLNTFPVTYEKTVNVPTEGFFNVQVFMEYTECSSFSKTIEYEGNSPILALPVTKVNITNVTKIYETSC